MNTIQQIFDKFSDQNWNDETKFQLFIKWFERTYSKFIPNSPEDGFESSSQMMRDFESYLQGIADEENSISIEDEPTVNFTARQISRSGAWLSFCDWSGMGEYAMNEGQCEPDEVFKIPLSKAKDWKLV